ncbi:MAG: 50S ribosomal protein L30 [Candidatus Micrarchaeota archaeon]|nr:MAG: 50S ribosomal protein L30 [Candidatus Micrarchaeota archaeon]
MSNNEIIVAIRIRGRVGVRSDVKETLNRLRLKRLYTVTLIKPDKSYEGMLKKCKDYIVYGRIDERLLKKLLKKFEISDKEDIDKLLSDRAKVTFRCRPPSKGLPGSKRPGRADSILGYSDEKVNELLSRML